jgi:hypothetical protein
MEVFKNKILIDNNKRYSDLKYFNKNIGILYSYSRTTDSFIYIRYEKNGYRYTIGFYYSYYQIVKSTYYPLKKRSLNIININYIIMYYSYFIYIKYYSFSNIKVYFNITNSITSRKLFNCRDYYKIYSYI